MSALETKCARRRQVYRLILNACPSLPHAARMSSSAAENPRQDVGLGYRYPHLLSDCRTAFRPVQCSRHTRVYHLPGAAAATLGPFGFVTVRRSPGPLARSSVKKIISHLRTHLQTIVVLKITSSRR